MSFVYVVRGTLWDVKKSTKYSTNKSVEFNLDFREIQRPTKIANGMFVEYSLPSRSL